MNRLSYTHKKNKTTYILSVLLIISINTIMAQVKNPYAGSKTAFMHDDALSSDVFTGKAPADNLHFVFENKKGAVPTLLQGTDDLLQVVSVRNESIDNSIKRTPYLLLLHPETMETMASFKLPAGRALNNIYGYLNDKDELLLANGKTIYRIAHSETENGWEFKIEEEFTLQSVVDDFEFVAITPDWKGNIWFASYDSQAGFLNPKTGKFNVISLSDKEDEIVANSISSSPTGIAIATTHRLYVLNLKKKQPKVLWQADYDRGNRVKPGKLSWGTGSSPSFFGPKKGYEYLTILDSGTEGTHLNIYNSKNGKLIASVLAFDGDIEQGSENSPIAFGNSVIIASTYGFVYPASSIATEEEGELKNGIQRFDVNTNGKGAKAIWFNKNVRTTSVPKMGKDSKRIHFINEDKNGEQSYAELDFETGNLMKNEKIAIDPYSVLPNDKQLTQKQKEAMMARIGNPFNAMQMAGLFDGNGTFYQGTIMGILKISSEEVSKESDNKMEKMLEN